MAIDIGRNTQVGFALESVALTPEASPAVYLEPSEAITLQGKHEPIPVEHATGSRLMDVSSVKGKQWSEGDLPINLDVVKSGYLFKLALGNEILATGTPNTHTLYTTVSGNAAKTATMWVKRSAADEEKFSVGCDSLTMSVTDGIGSLTASLMGTHPQADSDAAYTTTSGTIFSFANYSVKFGSTLANASGNNATPLTNLELTIANNLELIHRSQSTAGTASNNVQAIRTKDFKVSGSYTLFFEDEDHYQEYKNHNKQAMIISFVGNNNEQLDVKIPRFRLDDATIETGLSDFYAVTGNFVAEDVVESGVRMLQVILQNSKGTVY